MGEGILRTREMAFVGFTYAGSGIRSWTIGREVC